MINDNWSIDEHVLQRDLEWLTQEYDVVAIECEFVQNICRIRVEIEPGIGYNEYVTRSFMLEDPIEKSKLELKRIEAAVNHAVTRYTGYHTFKQCRNVYKHSYTVSSNAKGVKEVVKPMFADSFRDNLFSCDNPVLSEDMDNTGQLTGEQEVHNDI